MAEQGAGVLPADAGVLATDGTGLIGTVAFFLPAAVLVVIVAIIIYRDRREDRQDKTPDPPASG